MAISIAYCADYLRRGFNALDPNRQQNDLCHAPARAENTYHIVNGSACRRCYYSYLFGKLRQRLFVSRVKQPLGGKLCLELLVGYLKIACSLGYEIGAVELIGSVARKDRYTPKSSDAHSAFRAKAQLGRTAFKHDAAKTALCILEREIMVSRRIYLIV